MAVAPRCSSIFVLISRIPTQNSPEMAPPLFVSIDEYIREWRYVPDHTPTGPVLGLIAYFSVIFGLQSFLRSRRQRLGPDASQLISAAPLGYLMAAHNFVLLVASSLMFGGLLWSVANDVHINGVVSTLCRETDGRLGQVRKQTLLRGLS